MSEWEQYRPKVPAKNGTDRGVSRSEADAVLDRATARANLQKKLGIGPTESAVVLLMDCSSSMDVDDKLLHSQRGAVEFAEAALKKRYAVGVVRFAVGAELVSKPITELDTLRTAIGDLVAIGNTNMVPGLELAAEHLNAFKGRRAIVLVTDGLADDREHTLVLADALKATGIDIITIGTDDADVEFLRKLASRTDLASYVRRTHLVTAIAGAAAHLALPAPRK